jgi:hypothetical protein
MPVQSTAPASGAAAKPHSPQPSRAKASAMIPLLRAYPAIGEDDRLILLDFLLTGHPDEVANATYMDGMQPYVTAFKRDHPKAFRSGARMWLPLLGLVALLPVLLLLRYA